MIGRAFHATPMPHGSGTDVDRDGLLRTLTALMTPSGQSASSLHRWAVAY